MFHNLNNVLIGHLFLIFCYIYIEENIPAHKTKPTPLIPSLTT